MIANPSSSIAILGAESCILFLMRLSLFFASRRYLLRNLYHDLQDLSSDGEPLLSNIEREVELDTLPTPTTATLRDDAKAQVLKRTFHSTLSRLLFSLCFSESCTLFVLLICQGLDLFRARTRLLNWRLSLWLLLTMILVLIPLAYSLVLSYRSSSGRQTAIHRPSLLRVFLTALPVGLFLFLLSFVPLPAGLPTHDLWWNVLSRLTVVGTLILGLLSGFGAVTNAWRFFPSISRSSRKSATDEEVQVAEEGLQRVRNDLAAKRSSLARLELDLRPSDANTSWFSKVTSGLRSDNLSVRQEVSGLEALAYQMSRNLEALRSQRAEEVYSKTLTGGLMNWVGRLFAIYCVYRIAISALNILFPSRPSLTSPTAEEPSEGRTDFLTIVLAHLLSLLPSIRLDTADIALVSRLISLVLVGVIILSSIRRVLRGVARALRVTSRRLGASLMLLMLAQVMGIYLLSTLVQLRTSFPPPPTRPDTEPEVGLVNLFSTLPEYQVFGSVFDSSFLLAAGISAVVLWFYHRINSVGVVAM